MCAATSAHASSSTVQGLDAPLGAPVSKIAQGIVEIPRRRARLEASRMLPAFTQVALQARWRALPQLGGI
jgi:hypothetical protein